MRAVPPQLWSVAPMTIWPVYGRISGPIVVIDPQEKDKDLLDIRGIRFVKAGLTRENYREVLTPLLTAGGGQGFCVNLSVDTSSRDIMALSRELGALYIDTVAEPWAGFYFDKSKGPAARTNFALREQVLDLRRKT